MYVIPVTNDPAQVFVVQLGEKKLVFDIQWNDRNKLFSLTLSNDDTEQEYFHGVPLVLGTDFFEPYNYDIGTLILVDLTNLGTEANLENFGVTHNLYWLDSQEVSDVLSSTV